jgi:precorrin-6A/cobalt-precorrin-6A reductase
VISALAGSTLSPRKPIGDVRIGGFGGVDGLAAYLRDEHIDLLVDATHPFAAQISRHAAAAADYAGIPRLVLVRPQWQQVAGDRWIEVESLEHAVEAIPADVRRVFLTVGARGLPPFSMREDIWFLVRLVDKPDQAIPLPNHQLILGRGPFSESDERGLFAKHRIDCLVTRASGGDATVGKLAAARALSLPVVMVDRPPPPPGPAVDSLPATLTWIEETLGQRA